MAKSRGVYLLLGALMVGMLVGLAGVASALTATELLKQKPFPPTDVNLFTPMAYPDGPPLVPAAQSPSGETVMRNQLEALLEKRFGAGSAKVTNALAIYDADATKQKIPSPRLRATLLALKGTIGDAAINGVLNGPWATVRFADIPDTGSARSCFPESFGCDPPEIQFNSKFRYEDFRVLAPIMAHEALHSDSSSSNTEEIVANSIEPLIHGQLLLESPGVAAIRTELSRRQNTECLARLNSRDAQGNMRIFNSTGDDVLPGGDNDPLPSFGAAFDPPDHDTPGNAVLKSYMRNVVGSSVSLPASVNFDQATIDLLDQNQNALTDGQVVRLAHIFKLDIYKPTITNFSPTGSTSLRRPPIAATVSDTETDLPKTNIKLFVDGSQKSTFTYDRTTNRLRYTPPANLSLGTHTVRIVATDAQGKVGAKQWSFKVVRR